MLKQTFLLGALLLGLTACQNTNVTVDEAASLDTVSLLGSWHIEMIQGQATVDRSPAQLTFDTQGKLSGNNSCNQFFGQYQQQGEALTLSSSGGTTMRACIDALMRQEQQVIQALPQVAKVKMIQGRLTLLSHDDTPLLVLSPTK